MTGLTLKFESKTKNVIKELLSGIDVSGLEFDIGHWESYRDDIDGSQFDFNNMESIPSELIKTKILMEDYYVYPEFMELFVRESGTTGKKVFYYKDFIESNYIISIINYDYRNIEICCKNPEIIQQIKENFMNSSLQNKRIKEIDSISLDSVLQAWRQGKGIDE